jgi:integrase
VDGRPKWIHLPNTAHNKPLAVKLAEKKRLDKTLEDEGLKAKPKKPAPMLSRYIATYTTTTDVIAGRKTMDKLTANLADFLAHVGDRPLDQVSEQMVDDWRKALLKRRSKMTKGTWSPNTAQRVYNSVKGLFSYAVKHVDDFSANPCAKLADLSDNPAERRQWTPGDLWILDELDPLYELPLRVGLCSTIRRTEALTLTRHSLSPKGFAYDGITPKVGWIEVQRLKKKVGMVKDRIPVAVDLIERLRKQLKSPFQRCIFGDPAPTPGAWSSMLTKELRHIGEQYGVDTKGLCMHGTRHSAASTLDTVPGVGARTTQRMGGWSNLSQVQRYSGRADASMLVAAVGLAKAWGGRSKRPKRLVASKPPKERRQLRRKAASL